METLVAATLVFLAGYVINVFYVTVFYHRGLTHRALTIGPRVEKWIALSGPWVTGIDPKAWICMHRLHHMHSDTDKDPHSPVRFGVLGVAMGQLRSYEEVLRGLLKKQERYTKIVEDLNFDVSALNRNKFWMVPYLMHLAIGVTVGYAFGHPILGVAYFLGMMSHPVQGWMVNSLAHHYGYRNFETDDNSRNNSLVAWLVVGEGYQNNHHARPNEANFAAKRGEWDSGYLLCLFSDAVGLARLDRKRPLEAAGNA